MNLFAVLQLHTRHLIPLRSLKPLHAHIIVTSSSSCLFIANALLNLYVKSGHLLTARLVFETLPHKDVVSFNTLINAYSHSPTPSLVFHLFRRMLRNGCFPDTHSFTGVFASAASLSSDVFVTRQLHGAAVKAVRCSGLFVGSSLVNLYCKTGFVWDARKVFDEMSVRNSVTWATLVSGYAMHRLGREALEVFVLMRRSSSRERRDYENEFVFTAVLSGLVSPKLFDRGRQVHCVVVKNGLVGFVSVGNALVTMYSKCGSLHDAVRIFEMCGDKNSISWSAMISGFAQNGDSRKGLDFFSDMHFSGVIPTEFAFAGVISACSDIGALKQGQQVHGYLLKLGFEFQIYIMSALVDMYGKCGSLDDARKGFDCVEEPDIVLWSSMIGGYVINGENETALGLYSKMLREGFFPNELTMASILKACSNLSTYEQGKQIHACTVKYGFSLKFPMGSTLFTMYAKCGNLEDGKLIFNRMPTRDVVSWNAMISGLSQNGHGNEALELFEEMRSRGTEPDGVTFVNVLSACSHMGSVERGWIYFHMMSDEFGIAPRVEHYACMVDILSRAGKLTEAHDFIESATIDHGICLWRILLSACRNYRNYELGAYAGEKLLELGSLESQAYVLLSSIYTCLGRSEDVTRVRKMMSIRGVSKKPGCSWIELKNQVHVFVAGDMMHPQIEDIGFEIRRLMKHMKDEGYRPPST